MADINYVKSYEGSTERQFAKSYRGANYLRLAKLFQTQYVRAYSRHYLGQYTGTFEGTFDKTYVGTYLGSYTKTYSGGYTKSYVGQYTKTYTGQYTKTYEGQYTKTYTGIYEGTFGNQWEGAFEGAFTRAYSGQYEGGPYDITYLGTYTRVYTHAYVATYEGTYEGVFTKQFEGNYTRTFSRQFEGSFNKTYIGNYTAHWSRQFTATWSGLRDHNFSRTLTFTGPSYSNVINYSRNFIRGYTGPFQYFTGLRAYVGPDLAPGEPGNFYMGPANYARSLFSASYTGNYGSTPNYLGNWSSTSTSNVYIGTYVRAMVDNEPGFPLFFEDVYYQGSYTGVPRTVYNQYIGTYQAPAASFASSRNSIGTYTGQYEGTFDGIQYTGFFAGITYLGHYTKTYTGQYEGNFTRTFSANYEKSYTGQYTGQFNKSYIKGYARSYIGNYVGPQFYDGKTIGLFEGTYNRSYLKIFLHLFDATYTGQFEGEFNKQYSGLFNKQYEGTFNKQYEGSFDNTFGGTFNKTYVGTYLGNYTKTYVGEYSRQFEGTFVDGYEKSYIGHYSGSYLEASKSFAYFTQNYASPIQYNVSYSKAVTEVANTMHGELSEGGVKKIKEDGKWKQIKATKIKENNQWRDVAVTRVKENNEWKIVDVNYERTANTLQANTSQLNLKSFLESLGKSPSSRPQHVTITVNPDVYLYGGTNPAFDTSGMGAINSGGDALNHKVRLLVKPGGYVVGKSGTAGTKDNSTMIGGNGSDGGHAIKLGAGIDLFIENYGIIAGVAVVEVLVDIQLTVPLLIQQLLEVQVV